ncbi:MAG TPA: RluA family pseudouridine synthase [Acidimicrobiales bacterium]|nr:RluA family pseudouridine synthase [Acidimicrobiales bacterium]
MSADGEGTVIPASLDGERVDKVVALLTGLTRADVARLVDAEGVLLDGRPADTRHRKVVAGQRLEVSAGGAEVDGADSPVTAERVEFRVVHADDSIVVVDKPPGLVVHPGAGHRHGTLAAGIVDRFPDVADAALAGAGEPMRPGIVHRLDKDTSGLLVVARTPDAYRSLVGQLASRSMGRTYRALVVGSTAAEHGVIEAPVGRSERDPTRMTVSARGRAARTRYRVLERFHEPIDATLLEVELDTGRTHQIRVHLSAIGHPVLGDARYGGRRRDVSCPRPFLHAERLRLVHPVDGQPREYVAPLPDDLVEVLAAFR